MNKRYSDLIKLKTFEERLEYLADPSHVDRFEMTYGGMRYVNQAFYHSEEWHRVRRRIILRDNGLDLGCDDHPIPGRIIVHHINPMTLDVLESHPDDAMDPENLICVSHATHEAIHYGRPIEHHWTLERKPFDQCPWRTKERR